MQQIAIRLVLILLNTLRAKYFQITKCIDSFRQNFSQTSLNRWYYPIFFRLHQTSYSLINIFFIRCSSACLSQIEKHSRSTLNGFR